MLGYAMGRYVVVDFRPGVWKLMVSALQRAHTHSTFQNAAVSLQAAAAVKHVQLSPAPGGILRYLPCDGRPISGSSDCAGGFVLV